MVASVGEMPEYRCDRGKRAEKDVSKQFVTEATHVGLQTCKVEVEVVRSFSLVALDLPTA